MKNKLLLFATGVPPKGGSYIDNVGIGTFSHNSLSLPIIRIDNALIFLIRIY